MYMPACKILKKNNDSFELAFMTIREKIFSTERQINQIN